MEVPTARTLQEVYPETAIAPQTERWNALKTKFTEIYGKAPDFISRSPGRVNVIGEHVDYSLFSCLPAAIQSDVLIAVSVTRNSSKVQLNNVLSTKFKSGEFDIPESGDIDIDASELIWTNYFKAGLVGATELLRKKQSNFNGSVGMNILADGTVPSGGGLSSSAAFVCASALAVMKANGEDVVDKKELTEIAIVSERNVGVNSGGMDQTASVFPVQGSAVFVSFVPELSAKRVEFPELKSPLTFVIAQSFVAADKHTSGPVCYNLRVVEVTLAALVLAKLTGLKALPKDAGPLGYSLRGFHDTYFQEKKGIKNNHTTSEEGFAEQLEELSSEVESLLDQEGGYTREQISDILGVSVSELEKQYMQKFPIRAEHFQLRKRAKHVFTEARRVLKFMDLLSAPAPETDAENDKLLQLLGGLMNETQDSCRDLFENSCPELDELCELARSAGSYGSRLTGAGWGGCSVHLVPEDKVDAVRQKWIADYYKKRFPHITDAKLESAIVVSKPGSGSCVFELSKDAQIS